MGKQSYIPNQEALFYPWAKNLTTILSLDTNMMKWQIPFDTFNPVSEAFNDYEAKYLIATNPATKTKITIQNKNDAKVALTAQIRAFYRSYLLYNTKVTNGDRDMLQIPIHDTTHTPAPPPSTMPVGIIDTSIHQRHTIHVSDSVEVRPRGGLPAGVHGFEAWYKKGGDAPANEDDFTYLNFSSTATMIVNYPISETGTNIWYRFRWVNSRNDPGPWSESVISSIVP